MIKDFKDLQRLCKICRAQGVTEITVGGVQVKFGPMPINAEKQSKETFPEGELSDEQLAFYSAGGQPSDDPENY